MASLVKKVTEKKLSRRNFLKITAASTAGLALTGCGSLLVPTGEKYDTSAVNGQGKWITAGCNYDCGNRCLNKVLMVDGVAVRQKTDDTHPDSPEYPQQRGCVRGRAQRNQVFGADKLKYPMKRKHYTTGGGQKELRGIDEWERISWDEALTIVATELKNAKSKYGNRSILFPYFYPDPAKAIANALHHFGGYVGSWGTGSFGSWALPVMFTTGYEWWTSSVNDRFDFLNSETVVMFGLNPAWSSPGNGFYYYLQVKEAGAKFIHIDPFYNDSAAALGAEWMPIRVGTDTTLLLAIAYVLITEDDPVTNPLIDWDFLKKYTVGFDSTMMPEGADPKNNFKDYVLGTYDGQPKDPKWAFEICGLEPGKIRQLAYEIRKDKKVSMLSGYANGRISDSDALPQAFMAVGSMTGHYGKPGHNCGASPHRININCGPFLYTVGSDEKPMYGAALFGGAKGLSFPINTKINATDLWDAVLDGKANAVENPHGIIGSGPNIMQNFDIHMIFNFMGNALETSIKANKGIEAFRKVDFVVSCASYPSGTAMYSDIILPVTTFWENVGFISELGTRDAIIACSRVVDPLYEAKPCQWIAIELMKKLGMDPNELFPFSDEQGYFNSLKNTKVLEPNGEYVPLVTITAEDIAQWGVKGLPQQGKIGLQELLEKGVYQLDLKKYRYIAYEAFIKDPVANPRMTTSKKIEIHSATYAALVSELGITKKDPLPVYVPGAEGYEASFSDWKSKVKGEYPYQMFSIHYMGRAHTNFANNTWLQEAWEAPVYMSSADAQKESIKDGDTVLIQTKYGKILRRANVTERLMPGVMAIAHGSWMDLDKQTGIDKGGNENILCGTPVSGQGLSAYNSMLVKVEKWTGESLIPDSKKPKRVLA